MEDLIVKNRIQLPAILLVALLLGSTGAFAEQFNTEPVDSELPGTAGVYKMNLNYKSAGGEKPIPLPMPIEPEGGMGAGAAVLPGSEAKLGSGGINIGAVGGGTAMMTPKQRADRQIRKVIRTLY